MTTQERKEYMKKYREEHKDQIRASTERRNCRIALGNLDRIEVLENTTRFYTKDGRLFEFVRPFDS